ncbi:MAG: hypothetical protein JST89_23065 [Cyanobacteria bacterium SZAS-4]|nr:hypothetical protein [Cyanobacteria bacterium SZAS-4]
MLLLTDIQKKQFSDKTGAESDLLRFLKEHEDQSILKVELQPKPESLNSLNGFVTYASGERYFFKTHTEENEKVSEYYNAEELAKAGYPVITSKQITQKVGKQIVLYQIITYPTLFDLLKIEEDKGFAEGSASTSGSVEGSTSRATKDVLLGGQIALDKLVYEIYSKNLSTATAEEHAKAPIHQLFSHRLAEDGRVGLFYRNKILNLESTSIPFEELSKMRWTINGAEYSQSLNDLIAHSRDILSPTKTSIIPTKTPVVPGHGDAHNGNIFVDLENSKFYMFDPAFAGKHHPLLDLTKPLFHNVFARWMYYPDQVLQEFNLEFNIRDNSINIEHDFKPSQLRLAHLKTRVENVLRPTVALLKNDGGLDDSWRSFVRSALFCCPFLTVNLLSDYVANGTLSERYKPAVKLLGLAMAVELGATAHKGSNFLTDIIDEALA